MCNTYNTIGSLTTLKAQLYRNNIYDFRSLKNVIDFQNSYTIYRQNVISDHENLIEQEKSVLNTDLQQLVTDIENQRLQSEHTLKEEIEKLKQQSFNSTIHARTNFFHRLGKNLKRWNYNRKIKDKERNFDFEVKRSISELIDIQQTKSSRYQFITSQFSDAVEQSARHTLAEIERKKAVIDESRSLIYGALGEQKVVKTLEALSNEYFLINDFEVSFSDPIYNRKENDYIKSIQIDHILVAPSAIFLIETKNWSKKSLENSSLRSPVQQIKRTSFVLFKLLNNEVSSYHLHLDKHHWGDKKISIRNLIVFINSKPEEEFQYVKILALDELLGYIGYFKPIFSGIETQRIADYLISVNNQKTVVTKRT